MICPILEIGWMQTKVGKKGFSSDCLEEECARFDARNNQCIDISLTEAIESLGGLLMQIIAKMPHERNYVK